VPSRPRRSRERPTPQASKRIVAVLANGDSPFVGTTPIIAEMFLE
jgi:hypothetical protein